MTADTDQIVPQAEASAVKMPPSLRGLKVALVHDYLNQQGGAENVVKVLTDMFPDAPLYTSVYDRAGMPDEWRGLDIRTSFLQRLSPSVRFAKAMLPLYPLAFESFDLSRYDLVLSSATTFAKGVITRPETCHVCYCANPTRLLWMYHSYLEYEPLPLGARAVLPWLVTPLRAWDFAAAQRVDYYVANSRNAARRIAKFYRRESDVIHPPIDARRFHPARDIQDYFLIVARLQPYKRIDLAVAACTRLGLPLHIVGDGPDLARLKTLAGPTVRFHGRLADDDVNAYMARCRAYIQPGEEDFGLAPLEAQACGRPVVALGAGGALETVVEGVTGVYFREQTVECLAAMLTAFTDRFDSAACREHALQFDEPVFKARLFDLLARRYAEHGSRFEA